MEPPVEVLTKAIIHVHGTGDAAAAQLISVKPVLQHFDVHFIQALSVVWMAGDLARAAPMTGEGRLANSATDVDGRTVARDPPEVDEEASALAMTSVIRVLQAITTCFDKTNFHCISKKAQALAMIHCLAK